jgi:hypothetical protein
VLIESRTPGDDAWYPSFEADVLAETDRRVAVRPHWWASRQWYPKNGRFSRVAEIKES